MTANIDYLNEQQQKQADYYAEAIAAYEASKIEFQETATSPGTGFDIEYWLGLIPTPTIVGAVTTDIPDLASYHGNDLYPDVTKPVLITPDAVAELSEQGYDSAYLDQIEQEIRALTTDIIGSVLPANLYDSYYRLNSLPLAREASDGIDKAKEAEEGRGFASATGSLVRAVTEVVTMWQKKTYENQNKASKGILDFAVKTYFESIQNGIKIEDIRSRVIMDYARYYSKHNTTLAGYYSFLVDEKIAETKLALDNFNANLEQEKVNIRITQKDNKEEVDIVVNTFSRAVKRVKTEATVDTELVTRRHEAMQKIMNIYATWMASAIGSLQSTASSKYDITE